MSRIIVFGGHGRVALRLIPLLVDRGDDVTAVIRNADHADEVEAAGARPLVHDVERSGITDLAAVVAGHDAVVWSAGAGGGDPQRTYAVDRDAAIRTMDAAEQAGVTRYVMVSFSGSRADHGIPEDHTFFAYADAKWAADEHLRGTGLEWTILGPGTLTFDDPTGLIEVGEQGRSRVSRADVAAVIAATLVEPATVHQTIRFGGGQGGDPAPIAAALRAASGSGAD